jgi:1,4-dihydroxy-2-naphthoyl-CoA hydrolase
MSNSTDTDRLAALVGFMPFSQSLGIELSAAEAERVAGTMAWSAPRCTTAGLLHGGALMSFADSLGGICAFLNLPDGASTSTIESKTNFFRAVREGLVHGVTTPIHVGRTTIAVQTHLTDDADRLVALVTQTQAVLGPSPT